MTPASINRLAPAQGPRAVFQLIFNKMPVRLNDSQIRAYVDAFDQADRNEDGLISRSELLKLLQDLNLARTQEEMTEALKTLSLNNDYITRANLLHVMAFHSESQLLTTYVDCETTAGNAKEQVDSTKPNSFDFG